MTANSHNSEVIPKILYIEDDEAYAMLVGKRLRRAGYHFENCFDGEQGLQMVSEHDYDLVLVDYHLPKLDGLELIRMLSERGRHPPMVIVSAQEDLRAAVMAMKLGAEDYIVKSAQGDYFDLLFATIERVLERERLRKDKERTEQAFWTQQEILRNVLDNIPLNVFWKDTNSVYQGCNASFCEEFNLASPEDVKHLTDYDLHENEDEAVVHRENDLRIIRTGKPMLNVEQQYMKDFKASYQLVSKVPLRKQCGEIMGVLGIYSDITERKEMERANFAYNRQLKEKNVQLERKNQEIIKAQRQLVAQEKMASLGTMAAGIAHEIRNPLNFIQNMSAVSLEYLNELKEVITEERHAFTADAFEELIELLSDLGRNAEVINKHGLRASRVVQSMTELASSGSGRATPFNINALVEEYLQLVQDCRHLGRVNLQRDYDDTLGLVEMMGHNMGRVLINITNNAIDALVERSLAEPGFEPMLKVSTNGYEDAVEIRIKDNGLGISAEHQEKIFEPFFTTKPSGHGNIGLGLAMCYEIVVLEHGGELRVESEAGCGSEFIIRLPYSIRSTDHAQLPYPA